MNELTLRVLQTPFMLILAVVSAICSGYVTFKGLQYVLSKNGPRLPYPPGPKREPLIGTLRSFPKNHFYRQFCEWADTYGDIVYAPLPGMDIIVLNSYEVAQELLLKRPGSTAGRQVGYLMFNLMGWHWCLGFIQPGPNHSNQRKMLRKSIGPQRVSSYNTVIEAEVARLMTTLRDLKGNPGDTIQGTIGRMVTKATYGEKVWDQIGDGLSKWNMEAMDLFNEAFFVFWMVDLIPLLRFVPNWFPGTYFKKLGRESSYLTEQIRYRAYEQVQELYNAGTLDHCIANDLMDEFGQIGDVRDAMGWSLYSVSQRMFEEIQSVTYGERLLQITDRPNLPYTEATWKEAIRWRPFVPIGIPHMNDRDEIINGYFIPKGTAIHQNTGLMLTDPGVWGDPEVFRPERFLEDDAAKKPNPLTLIFGYDKVAFHLGATIASLFETLPLDGCKLPDPATIEYTDTVLRRPIGFECQFVPRNEKAQQLLKAVSIGD
ncbi:cytochrome P450 [Serendipita vermifera]|nr:cytochrome P450 [Serendipita vermifera]